MSSTIVHFKNRYQEFIYNNQMKWYEEYKETVGTGKILVVGHGLGYTMEIISKENSDIIGLDINLEEDALQKEKVVIYDGGVIPFPDNYFDVTVVTYTLHHANNPEELFREIARVSGEKMVVLEETYQSFFQKLDLIFYCWYFNRKAGQKVSVIWKSYLSHTRLLSFFAKEGLRIDKHNHIRSRSYQTELFVVSKD